MKFIIAFFALTQALRLINIKGSLMEIALCALSVGAAYFVSDNLFLLFKALNALIYIELVNFFVIPLVMFTIFLKKQPKQKGYVQDST